MRAVVLREFGPPSVLRLEAVAEPEGEALVEVAFASGAVGLIAAARIAPGETVLVEAAAGWPRVAGVGGVPRQVAAVADVLPERLGWRRGPGRVARCA